MQMSRNLTKAIIYFQLTLNVMVKEVAFKENKSTICILECSIILDEAAACQNSQTPIDHVFNLFIVRNSLSIYYLEDQAHRVSGSSTCHMSWIKLPMFIHHTKKHIVSYRFSELNPSRYLLLEPTLTLTGKLLFPSMWFMHPLSTFV